MSLDVGISDPVVELGATVRDGMLDGALLTAADLTRLQTAVVAAGLTGYDFENTTTLKTDLNRLRNELAAKTSFPHFCSNVSDRVFTDVAPTDTLGARTLGNVWFHGIRGRYSEVLLSLGFHQSDSVTPATNATLLEFPTYQLTAHPNENVDTEIKLSTPGSIEFALYHQSAFAGAAIYGIEVVGRTDLVSSVSVPLTFDIVPGVAGGRVQYVTINLKAGQVLTVSELLKFDIIVQYHNVGGSWIGWNQSFRTFNFGVISRVTDPAYVSRVISADSSDHVAFDAGEFDCTKSDGSAVVAGMIWSATVVNPAQAGGFWSYKTQPISHRIHETIGAPYEVWKSNRNRTDAWIAAGVNTQPSKLYNRTPHALELQDIFPDPPLSPVHHADERLRKDTNWAEFQTYEFTLGGPTGTQDFSLPELRTGFTSPVLVGGGTPRCEFWKLPLPGFTREQYLDFTYNSGTADPSAAKSETSADLPSDVYAGGEVGLIGSQATEYAFHQILTSADGGTFWYRDTVTHHPDNIAPANIYSLRRFPRWCIMPDGAGFALYLFNPQQSILVRIDPPEPGTPVYEYRSFYPSGAVSAEDYRASYKVGAGGLFVGNMPDFQPPYRYFPTPGKDETFGPVAVWTVGKQIGGAFAAGMSIKFQVQRRTVCSPAVDFAIKKRTCYDATVGFITDTLSHVSNSGLSLLREVHDVQTCRVARKFGLIIFRNKTAVISLYPDFYNRGRVHDLQLFTVTPTLQEGIAGYGPSPYAVESPANFAASGYVRLREINPGDYSTSFDSATGTTTITLLRTSDTVGDDEFAQVGISYDHHSGRLPSLEVTYGNLTNPYPQAFTPYRRSVVDAGYKHATAPFYYNSTEETVNPRWFRTSDWPMVYQRTLENVVYTYVQSSLTYSPKYPETTPGSTVSGILITAQFNEDCTIRFYGGWMSRYQFTYAAIKAKTGFSGGLSGNVLRTGAVVFSGLYRHEYKWTRLTGEKCLATWAGTVLNLTDSVGGAIPDDETLIESHTQHFLTQQDFLEGNNLVAPLIGGDAEMAVARMVAFSPVTCVQNFEVRGAWCETQDSVVGPDILGPPFGFHVNETARLAEAYVAAGKPA